NGDGGVAGQCRQCAACQPEFAAAGGAVSRIGGYTLVVCQPCRASWLPLRGSYCGAPPLRPGCKGKIPLRTPWPAFQLFPCLSSQLSIRGQGASMPLATRLESSKRCYWLCQTSGWNEWAGTTPAAAPARLNWVRYAHKSQKAKKP